jgi:hypothetical protein
VALSQGAEHHAQKKSLHAAEQDRPDVAEKRRAFIRRQPALDPAHLVFIDETWATTNMTRRHGRAARGLRLLAPVPHGHWQVTTLVAGLRRSGITALCVFDGAINGERFRTYVEQMLAPALRPDDVVLLDNLSSHKVVGAARRSRRKAHNSSTCRPTAPTSTQSSRLSPSSRRRCARRHNAPAKPSGRPLAKPSNATRRRSVETSLTKPAIQPDRKPL